MANDLAYAVIQLADRVRDERLNAALAIFSDRGLDLRLPKRLDKLRSLSAALDLESLRATLSNLSRFDELLVKDGIVSVPDRIRTLTELSNFAFSPPCAFKAPSAALYEDLATKLLKALVEPEPARLKSAPKRTRLVSLVRQALRKERVLAKPGEDLDSHRVLSNVHVAEGLSADFVLKNGAMHVMETVDASGDEVAPRRIVSDIAVSALVLEQSRMTFGENATTTRIVYEASAAAERVAMPSLSAAAHQGADIINWASQDDRNRLLVTLSALAMPLEVPRAKRSGLTNVHASTQQRLKLN